MQCVTNEVVVVVVFWIWWCRNGVAVVNSVSHGEVLQLCTWLSVPVVQCVAYGGVLQL